MALVSLGYRVTRLRQKDCGRLKGDAAGAWLAACGRPRSSGSPPASSPRVSRFRAEPSPHSGSSQGMVQGRRCARAAAPSPGCTSFVGYRVKLRGTEGHGRPRRPCALVGAYAARPCALAAPCALSGYALGTVVSGYALVIFCRLPHGKRGGGLRRAAGVLGLTPCGSAPHAYARVNYLEP